MSPSMNEEQDDIDKRVNTLVSLGEADVICDIRDIKPDYPQQSINSFGEKQNSTSKTLPKQQFTRHEYITHVATDMSIPHPFEALYIQTYIYHISSRTMQYT